MLQNGATSWKYILHLILRSGPQCNAELIKSSNGQNVERKKGKLLKVERKKGRKAKMSESADKRLHVVKENDEGRMEKYLKCKKNKFGGTKGRKLKMDKMSNGQKDDGQT